jgi:phosphoribosylamine--glycine ligase
MNVLLVGSGGREHALAWKIAQSPQLTRLVAAPGNLGIAKVAEIAAVKADAVPGLVRLAEEMAADLVVVGPEAALAQGLADALAALNIPCFGPTRAAAQLETSKGFTKAFCKRHSIPTADYVDCANAADATAALDRFTAPYVIKADGIAAGKGVVIAASRAEAEAAIADLFDGRFGAAGARVVIEAFMTGEEASVFALCDGRNAVLFGDAQDHKRVGDGDIGPNTGGMGAYSPALVMTKDRLAFVMEKMIAPTLAGMAAEGAPYRGVLYAGIMVTPEGPKLVEYNARFGDPECQTLMLRLKSDFLPLLAAAAEGRLATAPAPVWRDETAVCVVMAADGYPEAPKTGSVIRGTEANPPQDAVLFHAGTARREDGALVAAGGRVLNACGVGRDVAEARRAAYALVDQIDWPGGFCRRDIGWRALNPRLVAKTQ